MRILYSLFLSLAVSALATASCDMPMRIPTTSQQVQTDIKLAKRECLKDAGTATANGDKVRAYIDRLRKGAPSTSFGNYLRTQADDLESELNKLAPAGAATRAPARQPAQPQPVPPVRPVQPVVQPVAPQIPQAPPLTAAEERAIQDAVDAAIRAGQQPATQPPVTSMSDQAIANEMTALASRRNPDGTFPDNRDHIRYRLLEIEATARRTPVPVPPVPTPPIPPVIPTPIQAPSAPQRAAFMAAVQALPRLATSTAIGPVLEADFNLMDDRSRQDFLNRLTAISNAMRSADPSSANNLIDDLGNNIQGADTSVRALRARAAELAVAPPVLTAAEQMRKNVQDVLALLPNDVTPPALFDYDNMREASRPNYITLITQLSTRMRQTAPGILADSSDANKQALLQLVRDLDNLGADRTVQLLRDRLPNMGIQEAAAPVPPVPVPQPQPQPQPQPGPVDTSTMEPSEFNNLGQLEQELLRLQGLPGPADAGRTGRLRLLRQRRAQLVGGGAVAGGQPTANERYRALETKYRDEGLTQAEKAELIGLIDQKLNAPGVTVAEAAALSSFKRNIPAGIGEGSSD